MDTIPVVKTVATDEIVYRQFPDFETGFGIANAIQLFGGTETDYIEVQITQEEWDAYVASLSQ